MNRIDGIYYYTTLAPDEQKLLELYRKLDEDEQEKMLGVIELLKKSLDGGKE